MLMFTHQVAARVCVKTSWLPSWKYDVACDVIGYAVCAAVLIDSRPAFVLVELHLMEINQLRKALSTLSQKTATVAEYGEKTAIVALFCDSVDRA